MTTKAPKAPTNANGTHSRSNRIASKVRPTQAERRGIRISKSLADSIEAIATFRDITPSAYVKGILARAVEADLEECMSSGWACTAE